jgi:ribosomal protein L11 methyltransferase
VNQTRLFLQARKPEANHIYSILEAAMEEEGMPISLFEHDDHPGEWCVSLYVDKDQADLLEERVSQTLGSDAFGLKIEREELGNIDWVSETLRELAPVKAGRFIIHGSHDRDVPKANELAIEIDAGQAFGTGHHGTTAGCLDMLEAVLKLREYSNALDIGTGSGVLAVALARATNADILASDIDPVAVKVAKQNFVWNGCADRIDTVVSRGLENRIFHEHGPFDLIIANILAGPLQKMSASLCRELANGGTLILSGLLPYQKSRIVATYRMQGLALSYYHIRDGWLTLVLNG